MSMIPQQMLQLLLLLLLLLLLSLLLLLLLLLSRTTTRLRFPRRRLLPPRPRQGAAVHVPMVPKFGVCSGCQKALPEYGDFAEIDEKKFHAACVRCAECGVVLGDAVHQGDDGRLLCATHARTRTMHIGGALGMLPAMSKLQMQHEIATRTGEVPAEVDFEALRRSASGGNAASFAISDEEMRAAAASDRDESGGSGFARRPSLKTIGKTLSAVFKK
jgi:hypothetical protein